MALGQYVGIRNPDTRVTDDICTPRSSSDACPELSTANWWNSSDFKSSIRTPQFLLRHQSGPSARQLILTNGLIITATASSSTYDDQSHNNIAAITSVYAAQLSSPATARLVATLSSIFYQSKRHL